MYTLSSMLLIKNKSEHLWEKPENIAFCTETHLLWVQFTSHFRLHDAPMRVLTDRQLTKK